MWEPIINERREKVHIRKKIDCIYTSLENKIKDIDDFGLYMGKSGICLFLYYYQIMNKKKQIDIESIVDTLIDDSAKYEIRGYTDLTFYSEMALFMCHLYERKQININLDDHFSNIDDFLYKGMVLLLSDIKEYGCVNGAISIGMYFLYRYILGSEEHGKYLDSFIELLSKIAVKKDNTFEWISIIDSGTFEKGYNLGIAHGIPGILLFLRKLYLMNIKKEVVANLIVKTSNFLLSQKHSLKTQKSFFFNVCSQSSVSPNSGHDSRLALCYGDLSVGYSLFMVSSILGIERPDLNEIALDILINTTNRTNLDDINVVDAGLCHGTSGLAHMYNRLYHQSNQLKFRESALFWYKETIKMSKFENEYAGYRLPYYLKESEKEICERHNLSFLTGIAGTGLSLLSAIYPIEPCWDMCLLLS